MRQRLREWREVFLIGLAMALPRELAMWCAIRIGVHATTGRWSREIVPELLFVDALARWDQDNATQRKIGWHE